MSGELLKSGELSVSDEMPPPTMSWPEIATSHVMWSRLYHTAAGMGYDVTMNKSSIARFGHSSERYNPQALHETLECKITYTYFLYYKQGARFTHPLLHPIWIPSIT